MKSGTWLGLSALALVSTPAWGVLAPLPLGAAVVCAVLSEQAKRQQQLQVEYEKRVLIPERLRQQDADLVVRGAAIDARASVAVAQIEARQREQIRLLALMQGLAVGGRPVQMRPELPAAESQYVDVDLSALNFVSEAPQISQVEAESQIKGVRNGDLWQELEASNRHIWLVATTQSGKTWAEYAILTHAFDRSEGKAQAIVTDIKGGAFTEDCGIPDYYFSDNTDHMPRHAENIERAVKALSLRRQARMANGGTWSGGKKPAPLFLVIPELNSFVQKAKQWDLLNPPPSKQDIAAGEEARLKLAVQIGLHILEIITQGLEDNVRLIVDAQTSRIEEFDFGSGVKFTGGTRNNLSMAGISRNGDYIGIRDFFSFNCRGMAGNPEADLMEYDRSQQNKSIPIAATNMSGAVEIIQTPALDVKKMKRPWQPVGKVKAKPVTPIDIEAHSQTQSNSAISADDLQTDLNQWRKQIGRSPSDDELLAMYRRLTDNPTAQPDLSTLRRDLGW